MCSIPQTERNQRIVQEFIELNKTMDVPEVRKCLMAKYDLTGTSICKITQDIPRTRRCKCGAETVFSVKGAPVPCPKCAPEVEKPEKAEVLKEESPYFNWEELKGSTMVSSQYEEPKTRPAFQTITIRKHSGYLAVA